MTQESPVSPKAAIHDTEVRMITIGVDAHKRVHVAVALDAAGRQLGVWKGANSIGGPTLKTAQSCGHRGRTQRDRYASRPAGIGGRRVASDRGRVGRRGRPPHTQQNIPRRP